MASLNDIPVIGSFLHDARQELHGNPDAVKAGYDQQIQASKEAQERQMRFLMGAKQDARAIYAPMQAMFQKMYGGQGIAAPQTPQMPGNGRIDAMYNGAR